MDRIIQGYKMGGKVKYYNEGTLKQLQGYPLVVMQLLLYLVI